MNTHKTSPRQDEEDIVIQHLIKSAKIISNVVSRDIGNMRTQSDKTDCIAALNANLRTLAAINEVLTYYGDTGVFAEGL